MDKVECVCERFHKEISYIYSMINYSRALEYIMYCSCSSSRREENWNFNSAVTTWGKFLAEIFLTPNLACENANFLLQVASIWSIMSNWICFFFYLNFFLFDPFIHFYVPIITRCAMLNLRERALNFLLIFQLCTLHKRFFDCYQSNTSSLIAE